jgi:hypothetical protein
MTICVQFSDENQTSIVSLSLATKILNTAHFQGEVDAADPRWTSFVSGLPASMQNLVPKGQ